MIATRRARSRTPERFQLEDVHRQGIEPCLIAVLADLITAMRVEYPHDLDISADRERWNVCSGRGPTHGSDAKRKPRGKYGGIHILGYWKLRRRINRGLKDQPRKTI